jgi:6-phospho-beta-glucosidase
VAPPDRTGERLVGLKIAVVGGASTYTPELVQGFAARADRLPVDELVLLDIDPGRLEVVGGLARRILEARGFAGRLSLATDADEALEGANVAVVQLRVGGQAARLLDETLPLRFGCIGQETTGAGGFAKALRTVPIVLDLAERMAVRGAPRSWLVNFTNPVGIMTQALLDQGHRAIGLCNVAIGIQRSAAAHFGVEPDRVRLDHVGLNHLSWERAVYVDGVDRLPELIDGAAEELAAWSGIPADLIQGLRAIPSYYLRYYYLTDQVLAEQRAGTPRAEEVMRIERELLALYRDPELHDKPRLLEGRGGAYYSEAAAQLIASLHDAAGDVQVVDVRAGGVIPDLPDDAVVEVPAEIGSNGATPIATAPLAPELLGLVQEVKAYERLAAAAAVTGDRGTALNALLANPLVRQFDKAVGLLDALLEANRSHLPRFFPEG